MIEYVDSLSRDGRGLRAEFVWNGNRFAHAILAVAGGEATPLVESDSAPWQEVVAHQPAGSRKALLLTGAGDGDYWSAAVEPASADQSGRLSFELACLCGNGEALPTIVYRAAKGVTAVERDGGVILAVDGVRQFQFLPAAISASAAAECASTCRVTLAGRQIAVESPIVPHPSDRKSFRWRFEFSEIEPR